MTTGSSSSGGRTYQRAAKVFAYAVVIGTVFGVASSPTSAQKGGGTTPPLPDVAYIERTNNGQGNLWTMNLSGNTVSNKVRLLRNVTDSARPSLSPDRTKIAFGSYLDGAPGLWVIDSNGKNLTKIATVGTLPINPKWSPKPAPDGQYKILFADQVNGGTGGAADDLFVINPDGTEKQRLTSQDHVWGGDWSASATKIVANVAFPIGTGGDYRHHLWVFDVGQDGAGGIAVTGSIDLTATFGILNDHFINGPPAWANSNEDTFLVTAFQEADRTSRLYRVSYPGGAATAQLIPGSDGAFLPCFTLDDQRMLFQVGLNIYSLVSAGGTKTFLTAGISPSHRRQ